MLRLLLGGQATAWASSYRIGALNAWSSVRVAVAGSWRRDQVLALGQSVISIRQLFVDRRCIGRGGLLGAFALLARAGGGNMPHLPLTSFQP